MKKRGFVKLLLFSLMLLSSGCGRKDEKAVPGEYEVKSAGVTPESENINPESEDIKSEPESVIPGPEDIKSESESINPEPEDIKSESESINPEPEDIKSESESINSEPGNVRSEPENKKPGAEELLDAFLAGEISAFYNDRTYTLMVSDLIFDEADYFSYSVGDRVDLDNDGENEQILKGPYGGKYIDAREGKVYVLAEGEGTTGVLFYTNFENAVWIVHCDITHVGRQMYWLEKYDGSGNIVDEFELSAQYWDAPPGDKYDENSDFTYRDEKITMAEFEALRKEISGADIEPF